MSLAISGGSVVWVTKRSHLQVSKTEVLPVVFKARRHSSPADQVESIPPAFPETEAHLSDCLPVLKEWLLSRIDRLHRSGSMNVKPGALETPDVLRHGSHKFTVWFEPTAAFFSVLHPEKESTCDRESAEDANVAGDMYEGFSPTVQTLLVVAEVNN